MKPYLASLAVGLLVGIIYALLRVRSPAPPVVALIGLLGILAGEQIPSLVQPALKAASALWHADDRAGPPASGALPDPKDIGEDRNG